jgi:methyl-accepting chemotaxis protein
MFKKFSITTVLIIFISLVSLITSVFYTTYFYLKVKEQTMKGIDNVLISSARAANRILGESFHEKAKSQDSISEDEHYQNILKLCDVAKDNNLSYVYIMYQDKGKVYITASSAKDEELKKKTYDTYFTEYKDASPELFSAFKTGEITYDDTPDKYGHFRSVFIPLKSRDGRRYIAGADIEITEVENKIKQTLIISIAMGSIIFVFGLMLSICIAHLITKPLKDVTEIADHLSLGKGLDTEINITSFKEIVTLGNSLDRLRTSMNFAMKQIKKSEK